MSIELTMKRNTNRYDVVEHTVTPARTFRRWIAKFESLAKAKENYPRAMFVTTTTGDWSRY